MTTPSLAQIIILNSGKSLKYDLRQEEVVLGRAKTCDIPIDSNMVSSHHARILRQGARHFIEDLQSTNHTFVNGRRISGPVELKHDDRIKLGPILIRYCETAEESRPPLRDAQTDLTPRLTVNITDDGQSTSVVRATLDSTSSWFGAIKAKPEDKLNAMIQISQALAGTVELEQILPQIMDCLFTIFPPVDRGVILLKDETTGQMIPRVIRHREPGKDESVVLSRTIVNTVLEKRQGILSMDGLGPLNSTESLINFQLRSMMCMPLLGLAGDPIGLIHLDTKPHIDKRTHQPSQPPKRAFNQDDLELLATIARQASLFYANARLFASYMERKKLESEMQTAAEVQRALLPGRLPQVAGYQFFAAYESAQAVGGDYYDCRVMNDSRVWIAFGDVAGKGVAASLIMSRLSSVVQSTLEFVPEVSEALRRINTQMAVNMIEGRFVTLILANLDLATHELTIVSGGHMSPLIRRSDGTIEELAETVVGLPVGIVDELEFETVRRVLEPGETIVIYTDGISEAHNSQDQQYGMERLRDVVRRTPSTPSVLGKAILDEVHQHAAGSPPHDDITLMVFGRDPIPPGSAPPIP